MNCETAREWMSEYIDGLLDQERAAQFHAHLDQCAACRRELAAIEKTILLVRSLKPVEVPSDMVQRVHARLEVAEKPSVSLRPIKIFHPVLALAAGLVLILGFSTYFFLEQGRRQAGFRVASVEHTQAEEVSAGLPAGRSQSAPADKLSGRSDGNFGMVSVNRKRAGLSIEPDKAEAVRSSAVKEAVDTRSAEKDGRIWKGDETEAPRAKAMGLLTKEGEKDKMVAQSEIRRFAAGARAGAGAGAGRDMPSPAASAPPAVAGISAQVSETCRSEPQVFAYSAEVKPLATKAGLAKEGEAPVREEALMAKSARGAEPAVARQITVAKKSAAPRAPGARTSPVQPVVNLAIATTNRSAVEQVLLAFDEKRPGQKGQQADLKAAAKAAPALRMNAVSADDYNRVIAITVPASRWKELLAQLKSHGAVSVAGRDMETDKALSRAEAEIQADTAAESKDILTVHVTITAP